MYYYSFDFFQIFKNGKTTVHLQTISKEGCSLLTRFLGKYPGHFHEEQGEALGIRPLLEGWRQQSQVHLGERLLPTSA